MSKNDFVVVGEGSDTDDGDDGEGTIAIVATPTSATTAITTTNTTTTTNTNVAIVTAITAAVTTTAIKTIDATTAATTTATTAASTTTATTAAPTTTATTAATTTTATTAAPTTTATTAAPTTTATTAATTTTATTAAPTTTATTAAPTTTATTAATTTTATTAAPATTATTAAPTTAAPTTTATTTAATTATPTTTATTSTTTTTSQVDNKSDQHHNLKNNDEIADNDVNNVNIIINDKGYKDNDDDGNVGVVTMDNVNDDTIKIGFENKINDHEMKDLNNVVELKLDVPLQVDLSSFNSSSVIPTPTSLPAQYNELLCQKLRESNLKLKSAIAQLYEKQYIHSIKELKSIHESLDKSLQMSKVTSETLKQLTNSLFIVEDNLMKMPSSEQFIPDFNISLNRN